MIKFSIQTEMIHFKTNLGNSLLSHRYTQMNTDRRKEAVIECSADVVEALRTADESKCGKVMFIWN